MEFTRISKFAHFLFDSEKQAQQATAILAGLFEAQSPRLVVLSDMVDNL